VKVSNKKPEVQGPSVEARFLSPIVTLKTRPGLHFPLVHHDFFQGFQKCKEYIGNKTAQEIVFPHLFISTNFGLFFLAPDGVPLGRFPMIFSKAPKLCVLAKPATTD